MNPKLNLASEPKPITLEKLDKYNSPPFLIKEVQAKFTKTKTKVLN